MFPRAALLFCFLAAAALPAEAAESVQLRRSPASVSSLEIEQWDGVPLRVVAVLRGDLPDGCSEIEAVEQRFLPEQRTYRLTVSSARPSEAACIEVVTPYEIRLPVVDAGLASGEFTVEAGEVTSRFAIRPPGEFAGLDLPTADETAWICLVVPRLCFSPPSEWQRAGLEPTWESPPFLSARLGVRWSPEVDADPAASLPEGAEIHASDIARVGQAIGVRFAVERQGIWSEHLFVPCGAERRCELWLEAPSEPLLDAAGEAFWRLVRFAIRY